MSGTPVAPANAMSTHHCPDCDQSVGLVGGTRCCLCGRTLDVPAPRTGIPAYAIAGLLTLPLLGYGFYAMGTAPRGEFIGWAGTLTFFAGALCFAYAIGAGSAAGAVRPSFLAALRMLKGAKPL